MIKRLAIYEVERWDFKRRLIATGNKKGLLYEFLYCTDLKRKPVYYPPENVKLLYDGNSTIANIDI